MQLLQNLALGFETAFSATNLIYCFFGVTLGTFIGVLPGIGALAAVSVLMPVTFYMEPTAALVMLAGVYYGAEYGGSTASILLNLPGTASNAVTCLDGYPMARQGRAGAALFTTTIASFIGGSIGIVLLSLFAPAIADIALAFRSTEYVAIMILGLIAAAAISQASPTKGLIMVVLGVLLSTVGVDLHSGAPRYTFGMFELYDGVNIVILAMGLFGISEMIFAIQRGGTDRPVPQAVRLRSMVPTRDEVRRSVWPVFRGSGIGSVIGSLPGTGVTLAAFLGYALEKRVARDPSRFGKGAVEGIASPEAANNAAAQTAFVPTLSLGIPGSPTMALLLGAMMIHGIAPGPLVVTEHPDVFWGLVASFWIGNVLLLVLNIPLIGVWVRILRVPYRYLYLGILPLICTGVYSLRTEVFDVVLVLVVGVFGYFLRLLRFEPAPLLIAFVLGPMLEENFRRAMVLGRGDLLSLVSHPVSAVLFAIAFVILAWTAVSALLHLSRRRPRGAPEPAPAGDE